LGGEGETMKRYYSKEEMKKPQGEEVCPFCGRDRITMVWHHLSYNPPKIIRTCQSCHRRIHNDLNHPLNPENYREAPVIKDSLYSRQKRVVDMEGYFTRKKEERLKMRKYAKKLHQILAKEGAQTKTGLIVKVTGFRNENIKILDKLLEKLLQRGYIEKRVERDGMRGRPRTSYSLVKKK